MQHALKRWFIVLAVWLSSGHWLQAQEFSYVNYNTRDGLAGSVVYCMLQDQDGFIWFGTESGLSRFDGTRFTNFTMKDGLPDNEVIKLFTDSSHRVWIVPFKNALCYYKNGKLHTSSNDTLLARLQISGDVYTVQETRGDIIITEVNRISIIKKNGQIKTIVLPRARPIIEGGLGSNGDVAIAISDAYSGELVFCKVKNDTLVTMRAIKITGNLASNFIILSPELNLWGLENSFSVTGTRQMNSSLCQNPLAP